MMQQDYDAVEQVQTGREQIQKLANRNMPAELKKMLDDLDQSLAGLEGSGRTRRGSATGRTTLTQLNGELATVFELLQGSDNPPTAQAMSALETLQGRLQEELNAWKRVQTDQLSNVNNRLKSAGLPEISLQPVSQSMRGELNSADKDAEGDEP